MPDTDKVLELARAIVKHAQAKSPTLDNEAEVIISRALIERMEPVKVERFKRSLGNADYILCTCGGRAEIKSFFNFCPNCGRPLKWR